ncbi:MAG: purine nucleoside phosphorylase I, inosine and guanosine-specific [Ktedonobacteraceae bacterium]
MLYDHVLEAATALQTHSSMKPTVALILGSGLGELADAIENAVVVPYTGIPHFAHSTVVGHAGRLVLGTLDDVPVIAMQGRFHFYEGYSLQEVTFPVRVMHLLGAQVLLVSNAAGGVNPIYNTGDFMLLRDHISLPGLAGASPLMGANDERFGERFPPMAKAYDPELRRLALSVAERYLELTLHQGVYTMVAGPNYETGAELRFLRAIGTDAVGMSTVPEVIVARHMGMRVFGMSLITNTATGDESEEVNHQEVLTAGNAARAGFAALMRGIVREVPSLLS